VSEEFVRAGQARVCHVQHRCDAGVGTVYYVVLADGYLLDCGHEPIAKARAETLVEFINSRGAEAFNSQALIHRPQRPQP